ncbi:hypothetical protein ACR02B_003846 [Providencia stuartii]
MPVRACKATTRSQKEHQRRFADKAGGDVSGNARPALAPPEQPPLPLTG